MEIFSRSSENYAVNSTKRSLKEKVDGVLAPWAAKQSPLGHFSSINLPKNVND